MAFFPPPDKRPYRLASAPGDERVYTQNGVRCTYRQIGWHGQTGALYALSEDPSGHEPGSFSPLWLCVGVETIDEPEVPDLDIDIDSVRAAGHTLGEAIGRAKALAIVFDQSVQEALHRELKYAGLCDCPGKDAPLADWERDLLAGQPAEPATDDEGMRDTEADRDEEMRSAVGFGVA